MIIQGSSQIKEIDYNPTKKELIVTFHSGGKYKYENVNATIHTRLMNVESKGSYFTAEIAKNPKKYPCTKLGGKPTILVKNQPEMSRKHKMEEPLTLQIEAEDIKVDKKIEKISSRFHELVRNSKPKF
jgi:hypothetical protein